MKIAVIGDTHANINNLKIVFGFFKNLNVEAVVHTGDWGGINICKEAFSFGIPIYAVVGNADIDGETLNFLKKNCKGFNYDFLTINLGGRKIGVMHNLVKTSLPDKGYNVVFSGHFHSQYEKKIKNTLYIRPGSLSSNIRFAVYDTASGKVEFINDEI